MTEKKQKSTMVIVLIVLSIVGVVGFCFLGLLVAIAVPGFVKARDTSRMNACQENQAKMDGATQQYILEYNLDDLSETPFAGKQADSPAAQVLFGEDNYLKAYVACPSGGTYMFLNTEGNNYETIFCNHDGNNDGILDHPYPSY